MLLTFQRTADYSVYNNARHTERSGCLSILECSICHLFNFKTVLTILGHRHSDMHFTLCQITNTPTHAKILIWVALNLLHCLQNNNNIYKGTKKRNPTQYFECGKPFSPTIACLGTQPHWGLGCGLIPSWGYSSQRWLGFQVTHHTHGLCQPPHKYSQSICADQRFSTFFISGHT